MKIENVKLSQIKANKSNPRVIKDHKFHKLVKSLLVLPKMLELRPIVVSSDMTILGGNMRFRALQHIAKLPEDERIKILESSNEYNIKKDSDKEKLKAYWNVFCDSPIVPIVKANELSDAEQKEFIIKDNASFGEWDFDCLANEWDVADLNDWGVDLPTFDIDEGEEEREIIEDEAPEVDEDSEVDGNNPEAENLLNKAMQQYLAEYIAQMDVMLEKTGYICQGFTESFAKIKFIKSKFYNKKYPRYCSVIFNPDQFKTSASKKSVYEQMKESAKKGEAGIAGFRTITGSKGDNLNEVFKCGNYPIGSSKMPMDFPVEIARELIRRYSNKGNILDPCHGWGGRLTACMLEDVQSYTGIDPSPIASKGVEKIKKAFLEYSKTKEINLIKKPFEYCDLKENYYDFAICCPPYFDVEKYDGEETSTNLYKKYDVWKECFYRKLIEKVYKALKDNSYFALIVGSQKYPLRKDGISIAENVGFKCSIYKENCLPSNRSKLHETSDEESETIILMKK
jgi:hypothetical protein